MESTTCEPAERLPEPTREHVLVVPLAGPDRSAVELAPGEVLSIGRSRSSGVVIDDPAVSRLHATLRWDGGRRVVVTDHGSRNGTLVAGQRIEGARELEHGAVLCVGPQRLLVLLPVEETAAAPPSTSTPMTRARELALRAAASDLPVLLTGETGVGKEVLARTVHERSKRRAGPFVAQNCGAITESLAESILFGHERGAFTGAQTRTAGVFEAASGGTLFLDEIGELSASSQVRLLRVLEQREVTRVGATRPTRVDTRLVAATHRDLDAMVASGAFRADLLYRIDVIRIAIPPLRKRPDELPGLIDELLRDVDPSGEVRIGADARLLLLGHDWPGNVRELRNVLGRAVALRAGPVLAASDFPGLAGAAGRAGPLRSTVDDVERAAILAALEATGGNRTHAAARLGIARRTLLYKLERLGITFPTPNSSR
jgi:DNA-binding NtrC family response regulator